MEEPSLQPPPNFKWLGDETCCSLTHFTLTCIWHQCAFSRACLKNVQTMHYVTCMILIQLHSNISTLACSINHANCMPTVDQRVKRYSFTCARRILDLCTICYLIPLFCCSAIPLFPVSSILSYSSS